MNYLEELSYKAGWDAYWNTLRFDDRACPDPLMCFYEDGWDDAQAFAIEFFDITVRSEEEIYGNR